MIKVKSIRRGECLWRLTTRGAGGALKLADRHYNRQKPGTSQFCPPGRVLVLEAGRPTKAVWASLWQEKVDHAWKESWVCSIFRNEGAGLSSLLITQAVAVTLTYWEPPVGGIITFVDEEKIKNKRNPGYCFKMAGWTRLKEQTKVNKLIVYQMLPEDMPEPMRPGPEGFGL